MKNPRRFNVIPFFLIMLLYFLSCNNGSHKETGIIEKKIGDGSIQIGESSEPLTPPKIGQRLPLGSIIITRKPACLTLRFEPSDQIEELPSEQIVEQLKDALPYEDVHYGGEEFYYQEIWDDVVYILLDYSEINFLSDFDIIVHDYHGDVVVGIDEDSISERKELAKMDFDGKIGYTLESSGFNFIYKCEPWPPPTLGFSYNTETGTVDEYVAVKIRNIFIDSPSDHAGLLPGDDIIKVDNQPFDDLPSFSHLIEKAKENKKVTLTIHRSGKIADYSIFLNEE